MRAILSLTFLALCAAAGPAPTHKAVLPKPTVIQSPHPANCRDRVEEVRDSQGLPRLDRDAALPGEGYLIAAVDKRIDGCSVMVMLHDTSDIRPLPEAPSGPVQIERLQRQ
ncbi:MAG: hypothetical protein ABIT16_08920 [Croceibacterium sp.]